MLKNKWFQFSLALFVVPFVLNLVFYNQLPDVVPTHFDVNGQVDGTMPKFMGLFGMLFLCLAIHVFTCFVTVKDPKRNNIPDFMMNILFMICPVVCIVTSMTIIYFGLGYSFDVSFDCYDSIIIYNASYNCFNFCKKCQRSNILCNTSDDDSVASWYY